MPEEEVKKKRALNHDTLDRREKIKKILCRSYHTGLEIKNALEKQGIKISMRTIDRDMVEVKAQLRKEVSGEKVEDMFENFHIQNRGLEEEMWNAFIKTGSDQAKASIGRVIHEIQMDRIKLLQSMGIIREVLPVQTEPLIFSWEKPEWSKPKVEEDKKDESNTEVQPMEQAGAVPQEHG